MRWKKATCSTIAVKNIAMSTKNPASSLYTSENISAPNAHTIIAIVNFVNRFDFIIRNNLTPASKETHNYT